MQVGVMKGKYSCCHTEETCRKVSEYPTAGPQLGYQILTLFEFIYLDKKMKKIYFEIIMYEYQNDIALKKYMIQYFKGQQF